MKYQCISWHKNIVILPKHLNNGKLLLVLGWTPLPLLFEDIFEFPLLNAIGHQRWVFINMKKRQRPFRGFRINIRSWSVSSDDPRLMGCFLLYFNHLHQLSYLGTAQAKQVPPVGVLLYFNSPFLTRYNEAITNLTIAKAHISSWVLVLQERPHIIM